MRKISILKHKIIRAYNNKENWEYSKRHGYPEGTYFGFESLKELMKHVIKQYTEYYGSGLRKWRYD